jgi:N-acetylmuramoyl-L-alanine amidase
MQSGENTVKLRWLLTGTFVNSIIMSSSSVYAAELLSWRFDANQNQLEINTVGTVQPQAQLIFNPTRLVIDLPGTKFERPQLTQPIGGAIRAIRVGQYEPQMARIVVELDSGYTLNPNEVKFEGTNGSYWKVKLPKPSRDVLASSESPALKLYSVLRSNDRDNQQSESKNTDNNQRVITANPGVTQIENLQVTGDGFFVRTSGGNPQMKVNRSRDRTTIFVDISGSTLSPNLTQRDLQINKHGVSRVEFTQLQTTPPSVRLTLRVDKDSPNWQASTSSLGGLVFLPTSPIVNSLRNNNINIAENTRRNSVTTIESIELTLTGTQLLIRGNQSLSAKGEWDKATGLFRITVPNSQVAGDFKGPNLDANSPILRVRLQQKDSNTVLVYLQPASGVQIGELNQLNPQLLSVELQRSRAVTPSLSLPPLPLPRANPQSFPEPIINAPVRPPQPQARLPVPNGRVVIVVDPGHGGKDSGAPGLGGLLEKDVVLPISTRIASILQQNGVQAVLTRNSDFFVELQGRVDIAERSDADLFVSIHANAVGGGRSHVNGLETYYYQSGQRLAQVVHRTILQSIPTLKDRGVRKARFYVLRKSSMPSILVETGYMTGNEDNPRLGNPEYQNRMAEAIANGILNYLRGR